MDDVRKEVNPAAESKPEAVESDSEVEKKSETMETYSTPPCEPETEFVPVPSTESKPEPEPHPQPQLEFDDKPEPELDSKPEIIVKFEMNSITVSPSPAQSPTDVIEVIEEVISEPVKSIPTASAPDRASPNSPTKPADGDCKLDTGLQRRPTYHGAETDWPQVRLISAILFLGCIQMFVIGMSEWPYMKEIDKEATSTFFGYVGSVSALGHAVCAPLMGYWSSATGQTKNPMIAGRLIALVGCFIYVCLELFPRDRRYVMLTCYTIFGVSMSSVSVMRGYVAKVSTPADRARAISMFGLATMLAVTVGPTLAANIASLILIIFFFKEKHFDRAPSNNRKPLHRRPSQAKAALTTDMLSFNIPLALTCIFIRMAATLTIVTINTTTSPLMTSIFGWTNTQTVKVGSFTQSCVGVISLLIFLGFASGRLNKYVTERQGALISCILFALFFVFTYPWPFSGKPIVIKDAASNVTGCNPEVYKWCEDSLQVKPPIYLGSMVIVLGVAITLSSIAVDTLYSKILGNIDQGTMQGFFLFCLDIINVLGPLVVAPMFTASGQKVIWPIDGVVVGLATVACIIAYRKFPH
ncbi:Major facilitator superfamily domain-containing protein 8 [Toxocara canis]|uniref:Major facilitator superfamily domain-containing protein 8 n=1 Tax=Toxocara canis TaxID=6265 RepID=A0A0B2VZE8_TOXCA|nr:Major facilitator superfamily domain-containing protein 8 [Toxocara canis]